MLGKTKSLYGELGGRATLEKVHKIFYDKVFAHPWMSLFFADVEQQQIEDQQTEFMMKTFGGPSVFCGRPPMTAHIHVFVEDKLFEIRTELLKESLVEAKIPENLAIHWVDLDSSFRRAVVKKSVTQCKGRWVTDPVLAFPDPDLSLVGGKKTA